MIRFFFWVIVLVVVLGNSLLAYPVDRFTTNTNRVFLGTILHKENSRYTIERYGIIRTIPTLWITNLEKNRDNLLPNDAPNPLSPTYQATIPAAISGNELYANQVTINSSTPAEALNLRRYPARSHYWMPAYRFLIGHIANQTLDGFHRLDIEVIFYNDAQKKRLFTQEISIFKVLPMTMIPFRVDTQHVDWSLVSRIDFRVSNSVPLKRTSYMISP